MEKLINQYLSYCEVMKGLSPETSKSKLQCYNFFLKTSNVTRPEQITKELVESWVIKTASSRKWKARTVRLNLTYLDSLCQYLFSVGALLDNPIKGIPKPKTPKLLPKSLSEKETDDIMQSTYRYKSPKRELLQCMIALILYTGARLSELVSLLIEDINLPKCFIVIREGKGSKDRVVYYPTKLNFYLVGHIKDRDKGYLFRAERRSGAISKRMVHQYFSDLSKDGVHVYPHKLRHTYATRMLENGLSIKQLSDLMGHSNIETTAIYTKAFPLRTKEMMREIDY